MLKKNVRYSNYFKKLNYDNGKKDNLYKKYFYKINMSEKKCNIFQLMEDGLANQDSIEQVDNVCVKSLNCKNELEKKQIECMKSMILHHKKIPERWIAQENYKDLLNKVMEDPIVLSYAIISKDVFKKRSTSVTIDELEVEKNLKTSQTNPTFISYINPYRKNYSNSIEKHKLMRDYCNNIKNRKNKSLKSLDFKENNEQKIKEEKKNYYCNTEDSKKTVFPYIFSNNWSRKNKDNNKEDKNDKNEKLMMTSLHFDENTINKEDKDKDKNNLNKEKNKKENEEEINEKNDYNKDKDKSLELPMIE